MPPSKDAFLRHDRALAVTGVTEGACRHLIGSRLGITGAGWGLEGAEALSRCVL